ncbi:MAG: hypothetical protein R2824_18035 [Saprospiraceae bacterium]
MTATTTLALAIWEPELHCQPYGCTGDVTYSINRVGEEVIEEIKPESH